LTPIIRTTTDPGSLGIEGSRITIDADYVGKTFPLGSNGAKVGFAMCSSEGHFWILDLKNKDGETLVDAGSRAIIQAGIDPKMVDFYGDDETKPLGKWIEKEKGTYNSGIANRSNSHARAENAVKNALGGIRSTSLTASTPAKDWPCVAKVLSANISRESGNKFIGLYVGPLFAPGETSHLKLEPNVYTPPVNKPSATKIQFMFYNQNTSHALVVEFYY
jgi:hypothetical protein